MVIIARFNDFISDSLSNYSHIIITTFFKVRMEWRQFSLLLIVITDLWKVWQV